MEKQSLILNIYNTASVFHETLIFIEMQIFKIILKNFTFCKVSLSDLLSFRDQVLFLSPTPCCVMPETQWVFNEK